MLRFIFKIVVLAAVCAPGCLPDTSGLDPDLDRLIFPVGGELSPDGKWLYVANSNFDLEFNAGTIVALNVSSLAAEKNTAGEVSEDGAFRFLPISGFVDTEQTLEIGAFASDLHLTGDGDRLLVPARGAETIYVVETDDPERPLSCGQGSGKRCDAAHQVRSNEDFDLPIEPYSVTSIDVTEPDGGRTTLGFATHLANGEVSMFVARDGRTEGAEDPRLTKVVENVAAGAVGLDVNPVTGALYITTLREDFPRVSVMQVLKGAEDFAANRPFFGVVNDYLLPDSINAGFNGRDVVVRRDGSEAFLITREPEAVYGLDIATGRVTQTVIVGAEPSKLALLENDQGTADPTDDTTYIFVLCFASNQAFVVDPALKQVVAVRATGEGPQAITFDRENNWAYIVNFSESTVSVIETTLPFNHLRDDENRIVKIGLPSYLLDES